MNKKLYLVQEGQVTPLVEVDDLPLPQNYGRDWVVCAASTEEEALEYAGLVDSGEIDALFELDTLHRKFAGPELDRLAWHLADLGAAPSEDAIVAVRFGCPRLDGRSVNHANGDRERGLSVYAAEERAPGQWALSDGDGVGIGTLIGLVEDGKVPYLVRGDRIGTGSDGEPLLHNVELIGRLEFKKVALGLSLAD